MSKCLLNSIFFTIHSGRVWYLMKEKEQVCELYDLWSREAAYNTIIIYQSIWPNLIRVLHICVHIPTHPKLWDKTI